MLVHYAVAIWSLIWAGSMEDQLIENLNVGAEEFTPIEIAFICEGVASQEELQQKVADYARFKGELALTEKQVSKPDRKKAKILFKSLEKTLGDQQDSAYSLTDLMDTGAFSPVLATLVYFDLIEDAGIPLTAAPDEDALEPYFFTQKAVDFKSVLSALFLHKALALADVNAQAIGRALDISSLLAPKSSYGVDGLDQEVYVRAYRLFQDNSYQKSAHVAAAGAARFPEKAEFGALCINIGVKLIKQAEAEGNFDEVVPLCERLLPHTGEHQASFEKALSVLYFNQAVTLSDQEKWAESIHVAEKIEQPHDPQTHARLLIKAYEALAEAAFEAEDSAKVDEVMAELKKLDAERANTLRLRLMQLGVQQGKGDYDLAAALDVAAQQVGTEKGLKNYEAILNLYVQSLWKQNQFDKAFQTLDQAEQTIEESELVDNLRVNTYLSHIKGLDKTDYGQRIAAYQKLLSDKRLNLEPDVRKTYVNDYGSVMAEEIEKLIWNDQFRKADQKSKRALKALPNHEGLNTQRELLDKIMKRIGSD